MNYRKEIDGLRALALLFVILFHAGVRPIKGAFVGVDIFFVISGYLISNLILNELEKSTFSLITFYERRARRILPALFFVVICCFVPAWFLLLPLEFHMFSNSLIGVGLLSSNYVFLREMGYFHPVNELKPLLHTWSLATEEQFYLIFPLLFLLAWKWKRKGILSLVLVLFLMSFGVMQWGVINSPVANFYLLPGRIWEFLIGVFITLSIHPIQNKTESYSSVIAEAGSLLGAGLIIYSILTFDSGAAFPNVFSLVPLCGTALLILFAVPRTLVGKLLCSRLLVGIGLCSYSGYLWHQPLFAYTRLPLLRKPEPWIFAILIILNFILAYFSWKFIEQPFRNNKIVSRKTIFATSVFLSMAIIVFGIVGHFKKGFPGRFSNPILTIQEAVLESSKNISTIPGGKRHQYLLGQSPPMDLFIEDWKKDINSPSQLRPVPLAIFGSSLAADLQASIERQGFGPVGLFGSGCFINPIKDSRICQQLAETMFQYIQSHPNIKYLALVERTHYEDQLSLDYFRQIVEFWKPLGIKIIIFSPKPEFLFFKETLGRGNYPEPSLKFSELGNRAELRNYLASENIHLVNSKIIFCEISGNCDFKIGPKSQFRAKDFIYHDGYHLTVTGQWEFSRILLNTDPVFKEIIRETQN